MSEASNFDNQAIDDLDLDNASGVRVATKIDDDFDSSGDSHTSDESGRKQPPLNSIIRYRYTITELKNLREETACKQLPDFYDARMTFWRRYGRSSEEENPPPPLPTRDRRERSNYDSNGSSNGSSRSEPRSRNERGDSKDPKERLKKEDNIILSPQRRSFNMGCQMPPPSSNNNPPLAGSSLLRSDRDILGASSRRIGSGRILSRDVPWDYRTSSDSNNKKEEPEYNYRGGANSGGGTNPRNSGPPYRNDEKSYDRRSEYDRRDERPNYDRNGPPRSYNSRNGQNSGGYDRRRHYSDKDEEPEWFSGGPTSQHDIIELHGFDGPEDKDKDLKKSRGDERRPNRDDDMFAEEEIERGYGDERNEVLRNRTEQDTNNNKDQENNRRDQSGNSNNAVDNKIDDDGFNFEEFLNIDSITGLLTTNQDQAPKESNTGGSRFSQWFKQSSPTKSLKTIPQHDSRRSSLHDELNNLIGDFNKDLLAPGHPITKHNPQQQQQQQHGGGGATDSNKYFAPISPASNTTNANNSNMRLLELIQKTGGSSQVIEKFLQQQQQTNMDPRSLLFLLEQQQKPSGLNSPSLSQMPSVEELEARFRQTNPNPDLSPNPSAVPRIITSKNSGGPGNALPPSVNAPSGPVQDINAFKRLLSQMTDVGGAAGGAANSANNPLLMSMHIQQQQQTFMQLLSNKQNPPQNADEMKQHMFTLMKAMQQQQQQSQGPPPPVPTGRPIQGQGSKQQQTDTLLQNMLHVNQIPPHTQTHLQPSLSQTEILKRPEAQLIIQNLIRGDMKQQTLWQQLANPATTPRQREVINAVLSTVNASPRGTSPNILIPPGGAPIPIPPIPHPADLQAQILLQQQKQQQMRVSPLPNAFTVPPVMANNPLTLHVPGIPQRIPSPRELQYHTQSIMQSALIRKKLEEQRENFRKRQEAAAQQQNPGTPCSSAANVMTNSSNGGPASSTTIASSSQKPGGDSVQGGTTTHNIQHSSPVKHTASPTPLAFTPTSVLRKMTAEKESEPNTSNQIGGLVSIANSGSANPGSVLLNSIANTGNKPMMASQQGGGAPRDTSVTIQSAALQREQQRILNQQAAHAQVQLNTNMTNMQMKMNAAASISNGPPISQQLRNNSNVGAQSVNHMAWMNQMQQQQQQQQQVLKPQGRPIVKGNQSNVSGPPNHPPIQMPPFNSHSGGNNPLMGGPNAFAASTASEYNLHLQRQKAQQQQQQQQQSQQLMNQVGAGNNTNMSQMTAQQIQQLMQHRQAQQAQQAQRLQNDLRYRQMMQQQQHGNAAMNDVPLGGDRGIMNFGRDGGLSPTSNQLARWFSPELLAQANAGKLPSLNSGQALSLEEFERNMQHSSTVHN